jgi:hypothetical protein
MAIYLVKLAALIEREVEADSYVSAIRDTQAQVKKETGVLWEVTDATQIWPARAKAVKRG